MQAPEAYRKLPKLSELSLLVATEKELPSMFGTIKLMVNESSVILDRVKQGQVSLHQNHNTDEPIGRVVEASVSAGVLYACVHVARTLSGQAYLDSVNAGTRMGISPGFLINTLKLTETKDGDLCSIVSEWEPYEISGTSIPRNSEARVLTGRFSMNATAIEGPKLVNTKDTVQLEIACLRLALETKQGSPRQRKAMQTYLSEYDRLIGTGMNGHLAAKQAAELAKRSV